jgi:WD40 repeat protein
VLKKNEKTVKNFKKKMECLNAGGRVQCSSSYDDFIAFGIEKDVVVYRISKMTTEREIARMGFTNTVWSVTISPCGTHVVVGFYSGLVEMRSLMDAGFKRFFQGHDIIVYKILFSMCGARGDTYPLMISGSGSNIVKIWDLVTGVCLATVDSTNFVYGLTLLPGGQEILAGTYDGMLVVIGIDGIKKREVQIEGGTGVGALACAGDAVVVGLNDGRLQLREAARLDHVVWSSQVHQGWITDVCVSPSGAEIATVSDDFTSAVVSFTTGEIFRFLRGHTDYVFTVLFTPDGSKVITGSWDKTIRTCDLFLKSRKRLLSVLYSIEPEKLLYHGDEVVTELYYRLKRIMFAAGGVEKD